MSDPVHFFFQDDPNRNQQLDYYYYDDESGIYSDRRGDFNRDFYNTEENLTPEYINYYDYDMDEKIRDIRKNDAIFR